MRYNVPRLGGKEVFRVVGTPALYLVRRSPLFWAEPYEGGHDFDSILGWLRAAMMPLGRAILPKARGWNPTRGGPSEGNVNKGWVEKTSKVAGFQFPANNSVIALCNGCVRHEFQRLVRDVVNLLCHIN